MASVAPELRPALRDRAFELLYRRHVEDVYHYALALLRNPADAEDVTQTTFLNAYRAYQRGEEPLKPQNWLIKIAHNAARTRYARASRRVKEVPLDDHLDALAVFDEEKPDLHGVLDALGRLPFNQRAALAMRELEGRSYKEIAETLEVSVSAVETLIFRARRSLRMKASALRSLAVVPLPTSLASMFESGTGVVAGGGVLAGSSLLIKAVVAVVAGVVATGVGGDRTVSAKAANAPRTFGGALAQQQIGLPAGGVFSARGLGGRNATVPARRTAAGGRSSTGTGSPDSRTDETRVGIDAAASSGGAIGAAASSAAPPTSEPGPEFTPTPVARTAAGRPAGHEPQAGPSPVVQIAQAVEAAKSAAPAAPVSLPQAPPVSAPALPTPPPLQLPPAPPAPSLP